MRPRLALVPRQRGRHRGVVAVGGTSAGTCRDHSVGLHAGPIRALGQRDTVATAKKDMQSGEMLDGEGGPAIWAKAIPAAAQYRVGALRWDSRATSAWSDRSERTMLSSYADVDLVNDCDIATVRRQIEDRFKPLKGVAAQ